MKPLHITHGDAANNFLRSIDIEGDFLSWDDVLHQGPIVGDVSLQQFSKIRADYMAKIGWGDVKHILGKFEYRDSTFIDAINNRTVVLWNSWELFDQLHLMQICDWLYRNIEQENAVRIVFVGDYIGSPHISNEQWQQMAAQPQDLSFEQIQLAAKLWRSWTQPTPEALFNAYNELDLSIIPFIKQALTRLINELPAKRTGLSHSEKLILKSLSKEPQSLADMFNYVCKKERIVFMGDLSFIGVIDAMTNSQMPLLLPEDRGPFIAEQTMHDRNEWMQRCFYLTADGENVLQQRMDWLRHHQIDRWWGGTHLTPRNDWRWDAKAHQVFCKG